jgi:hypothetical protein
MDKKPQVLSNSSASIKILLRGRSGSFISISLRYTGGDSCVPDGSLPNDYKVISLDITNAETVKYLVNMRLKGCEIAMRYDDDLISTADIARL